MVSEKIRVLFICVANSFRSQVAEAILNQKYGDIFEAESAGFDTKPINPLAVEVMKEYGIDISKNSTDRVMDLYRQGRMYQYIITVCNREEEKDCPISPGFTTRLSWSDFGDPEKFAGTEDEQKHNAIRLRDEIEVKIDEFVCGL